MTARGVVIDTVTGAIKRKIAGAPEMMAQQVQPGESLFVLADDPGGLIDDAYLVVSEIGTLVLTETAPQDRTAPAFDLQYVAT